MGETPLYTALQRLADQAPLRLNVPGHHGLPIPGMTHPATALDFTEHPAIGDLYRRGGAVDCAQALWARAWDMPTCQLLTGGSTQGITAAFLAACKPGDAVLIDRACHRAVYHAVALLGLKPHYILRDMETVITEKMVVDSIQKHPKAKAICITSPTYYGVLSKIPSLDDVVIIVDAAHGAHLPFCGGNPFAGADLVVTSAHKTLPVFGQGALLFSGGRFSGDELRRAAAVAGTSSPSFLVLASLDLARAHMEGAGGEILRRAIPRLAALRAHYPSQGGAIDPLRLTLRVQDGVAVGEALEARGILPELVDGRHVVFVFGAVCAEEEIDRLETALAQVPEAMHPPRGPFPSPPPPAVVLPPREAMFCPCEAVSLSQAEGRMAVECIAPCPPGVPVAAPGERLTKKHLAYLEEIGYNLSESVMVGR